jgi:surface polysaccharide O-acyltransferase-like enzyme
MLIKINSDKRILPIIYFIIISFINEILKDFYLKIDKEFKLIQSLSQICLIFFYLYEKKILKNDQFNKMENSPAIIVFAYLIFIQIFLYINHFLKKYKLQDNDYSFYDIIFIILIEIFVFKKKNIYIILFHV